MDKTSSKETSSSSSSPTVNSALREQVIEKCRQIRGIRKFLIVGIDTEHVNNTINSMSYCLTGSNLPIASQNNANFMLDKYTILRNESGTRKVSLYNLIGLHNIFNVARAVDILRLILEGIIEPNGFRMCLKMDEVSMKKLDKKERNVNQFFDGILFIEDCPNYGFCELSEDETDSESENDDEDEDSEENILDQPITFGIPEVDEENEDDEIINQNSSNPIISSLGTPHDHSQNCESQKLNLVGLLVKGCQDSKFEGIKNIPMIRIVPQENIKDPGKTSITPEIIGGKNNTSEAAAGLNSPNLQNPDFQNNDMFLHENAQSMTDTRISRNKLRELKRSESLKLRKVNSFSVLDNQNLAKQAAKQALLQNLESQGRLNKYGSNEWQLKNMNGSTSSIEEVGTGLYSFVNPNDDISSSVRGSLESISSRMSNSSAKYNSNKNNNIQLPDTFRPIDTYTWYLKTETSLASSQSLQNRILEPTLLPPDKIKPEKHNQLLRILNDLFAILNEPNGDVANRNRIRVQTDKKDENEGGKGRKSSKKFKRKVSKFFKKII